jgi:hypothetical protein
VLKHTYSEAAEEGQPEDRRGVSWRLLLLFVQLEYSTRSLQVEAVSVDDQPIFTSVFRDVVYVLNGVAAFSKRLNEEFDIYHAPQFTDQSIVSSRL